ncbi:cell adhesion molecule Dscam1-like [Glandiceps talaboti]
MLSTLTVSSVQRSDNGSYSCEVYNDYGDSADSASFVLIVLERPDAVVISRFESTNSESINIAWRILFTGNQDITGCYVEYQRVETVEWIPSMDDNDNSSLYSHIVKNLEPFTEYRVRVSCENFIGNSTYTESDYIRTKATGATPPRDVDVMALSDTELKVTWVEPISHRGNLIHYLVRYNEVEGETRVKQSDGLKTILILSDLLAYTEYSISVIAVNEGGLKSVPSIGTISRTLVGRPSSVTAPKPLNDASRQPTHNSFWVALERASERNGPISCYEVIVIRLKIDPIKYVYTLNTIQDNPDQVFPPDKIKSYREAEPGVAYSAIKFSSDDFENEIQVGAGEVSSCGNPGPERGRTKRAGYDVEAVNGKLAETEVYTSFLRAYVDNPNGGEPYYTSSPFMEPIETAEGQESPVVIAFVFVIIVVLVIVIIILGIILFRALFM